MVWTASKIKQLCQSESVFEEALDVMPMFRSITRGILGSSLGVNVILDTCEDEIVEIFVLGDQVLCKKCDNRDKLCFHATLVALCMCLPRNSPVTNTWTEERIKSLCVTDFVYAEALEMLPLFKSIVDRMYSSCDSSILHVHLRTFENISVHVSVCENVISCAYCLSRWFLCVHGALVAMYLQRHAEPCRKKKFKSISSSW